MPNYDFGCRPCELRWEVTLRMCAISDHLESCPACQQPAEQLYDHISGMVRVRGGASPTRFGDGSHKTVSTGEDPGFVKEFESIYAEDGMVSPSTGEEYTIMDDEGGSGPYAGLESDKANFKASREAAERAGTLPSRKQQAASKTTYFKNMLKRSRDKLRHWDAKKKGSKS